jgi:hypothetical protein
MIFIGNHPCGRFFLSSGGAGWQAQISGPMSGPQWSKARDNLQHNFSKSKQLPQNMKRKLQHIVQQNYMLVYHDISTLVNNKNITFFFRNSPANVSSVSFFQFTQDFNQM